MSDKTKIEWTDAVWNPLRGCSKVSEGCRNCYAIKQAHRFSGPERPYEGLTEKTAAGVNWTGKVMLVPGKLGEPLKWKEPKRIFVNSMSDLFHSEVPENFISHVFAVMSLAPRHTFQILTKRPERMAAYLSHENTVADIHYFRDKMLDEELSFASGPFERWSQEEFHSGAVVETLSGYEPGIEKWPLPNVWLGTSVENQKAADERIPLLLQTPAAIRFLSCEPLIGELSLQGSDKRDGSYRHYLQYINWVITGGESGPGARPVNPDWIRSLRDQCQAAGVAFHFKQWGEWAPGMNFPDHIPSGTSYSFADHEDDVRTVWKVGKKAAGRLLDGRTWDEFPGELPLPFADEDVLEVAD